MRRDPFELSILGGATERAWRRERPAIEPLPWDPLDPGALAPLPLQQATARAQRHPLITGVLRRVARDESAHGAFGWLFFDWAHELIGEGERAHLRGVARESIDTVTQLIEGGASDDEATFGWL